MLIQLLVNTILQETTFINIYANNPFILLQNCRIDEDIIHCQYFFFRQNCRTLSKMMNDPG